MGCIRVKISTLSKAAAETMVSLWAVGKYMMEINLAGQLGEEITYTSENGAR